MKLGQPSLGRPSGLLGRAAEAPGLSLRRPSARSHCACVTTPPRGPPTTSGCASSVELQSRSRASGSCSSSSCFSATICAGVLPSFLQSSSNTCWGEGWREEGSALLPAPPAGAGGRVSEFQPRAATEPGTTLVEMGYPRWQTP